MDSFKKIFLLLFVSLLAASGCETLKVSKPLISIQEYETMLMGRLDANYVGNDACLYACHAHDQIRRDFEASTMGAQLSAKSGMPLVNCESCHGPGSLAIEGITQEKVARDEEEKKQTACNYETLIDLKTLPAQAQSLLCLKCHSANSSFNLHNWNSGAHSISDVSCFDCHNVHQGADLITRPMDVNDMCFKCHQVQQAEFMLPSHHPVQENKMICTDCHDAHGTINEKSLREDTVQETCTQCHGEKEGPYVFEHADATEDCTTCHRPHGSVNNYILNVSVPFLCLQCHSVHMTSSTASAESKAAFNTRCTDCHSHIHGTDLPSTTGKGFFIH